jgi:hypothetical protein
VVDYYPYKSKGREIQGSLHVYLIDFKMDLRGIWVRRKGRSWRFTMPTKVTTDWETQKEVRFPIIDFTEPQMNKDLLKSIIEEGRKFIEEKYLKDEKNYKSNLKNNRLAKPPGQKPKFKHKTITTSYPRENRDNYRPLWKR